MFKRRSDAELLGRAHREPDAFAAFYRRHEVLVIRFLVSRCRDPELAADLTAEVFARVLETASSFDPERTESASAVPWLLTIAMNTLRTSIRKGSVAEDARRRLGCEPAVLEDEELARVEELADSGIGLERALAELPADLRDAVVARILDESPYEEIADKLGCSQMVARKRVSRGVAKLRGLVQRDWEESDCRGH